MPCGKPVYAGRHDDHEDGEPCYHGHELPGGEPVEPGPPPLHIVAGFGQVEEPGCFALLKDLELRPVRLASTGAYDCRLLSRSDQAKPTLPTEGMMRARTITSAQSTRRPLTCARRTRMSTSSTTPLAQMSATDCQGRRLIDAVTRPIMARHEPRREIVTTAAYVEVGHRAVVARCPTAAGFGVSARRSARP